jgi:hypothetical protein
MLPRTPLSPLDLPAAIAETQRASGASGVVDLLAPALAGARVRRDRDIDEFLPLLRSACRQTGRHREMVPVLRRIAELNPDRRHEVAAELAVVHGHLGEPAKGLTLLRSALAEQRKLPEGLRCLEFFVVAEVAAVVLGRPDLARQIAAAGRHAVPAEFRPRPEAEAVQPVLVAVRAVPATAASVRAAGVRAASVPAAGVPAAAGRAGGRPARSGPTADRVERPVQLVVARPVRDRELVLLRAQRGRRRGASPAFLRRFTHAVPPAAAQRVPAAAG